MCHTDGWLLLWGTAGQNDQHQSSHEAVLAGRPGQWTLGDRSSDARSEAMSRDSCDVVTKSRP